MCAQHIPVQFVVWTEVLFVFREETHGAKLSISGIGGLLKPFTVVMGHRFSVHMCVQQENDY